MFTAIQEALKGKKTYTSAALMALSAVGFWYYGQTDLFKAVVTVLESGAFAAMRAAVSRAEWRD